MRSSELRSKPGPWSRPLARWAVAFVAIVLAPGQAGLAQPEGRIALERFMQWKSAPPNSGLPFDEALTKYQQKLKADGMTDAQAERTIRLIAAHDEAQLYNRVYAGPPEFNTEPNRLLVEAVEEVRPGSACRRPESTRRPRASRLMRCVLLTKSSTSAVSAGI
jgi:hypothetical protein